MWVTNEILFQVRIGKFEEELLMNSYLLVYLLGSNKLVYEMAIELENWIRNYFDCSHFYVYRLFHVYLFDSSKTFQIFVYNWEIDVLRFIINAEMCMVLVCTCLIGSRFIFHFLCWYLSSEKWKIRKMPTYNLSIISLSCLRGIIRSHSFIVNPDHWLLSLYIFFLLAVFTFIMILSPLSAGSTSSDDSDALDLYP